MRLAVWEGLKYSTSARSDFLSLSFNCEFGICGWSLFSSSTISSLIFILLLLLLSIKGKFESIASNVVEVKTEAPKLKVVEIKEEEVKAEEVKSEELNASEVKEEAE